MKQIRDHRDRSRTFQKMELLQQNLERGCERAYIKVSESHFGTQKDHCSYET